MIERDIRLIEFYNNLKDFDFDLFGCYKVDKNEAKKVISAIEFLQLNIPSKERVENVRIIDKSTGFIGECPKCHLTISKNHSKVQCALCGTNLDWGK